MTAVVSILHDLSEIRELERRRVEQQLFESEKLAAVGRLAASIAHEVNNPLEAIKNSLFLLQSTADAESNARFLEIARKETERVSHIIRQMLGFARRSGGVEWINANQVIEETLVLVDKKMRQSGIKIIRDFDDAIAGRARAPGSVEAGLPEPDTQRATGNRAQWRDHSKNVALHYGACAFDFGRDKRHGRRDKRRGAGADIRAVLFDANKRNGSWSVGYARHHSPSRRSHRSVQRERARHNFSNHSSGRFARA